jgi:hypothetical protein
MTKLTQVLEKAIAPIPLAPAPINRSFDFLKKDKYIHPRKAKFSRNFMGSMIDLLLKMGIPRV